MVSGRRTVAGVDGARGGWIAVVADFARQRFAAHAAEHFSELNNGPLSPAVFVAIDMPIGLAESGSRHCETEARRILGRPRSSSVFPSPWRAMLEIATYSEANAWGKARGRGLSKQAWNLVPKIRELDRIIEPADQTRLRETHPELVFRHLNNGCCPPPKRTAEGLAQRRRLLRAAGVTGIDEMREAVPKRFAREDDLLDACALAVAAKRMAEGVACRLPIGDGAQRDARGRAMEIWY